MNPWILHVKKYALEHNLSYKDAMSKAKPTYKKIQGSGIFDVFGKLYNMDKARKDKKAARVRQIQDEYRALKAAEKAAAAAPVVASTPVVGSGKRRGRPKGSKNKVKKGGNILNDIRHSVATIGNTLNYLNPGKAIQKALKG